MKINHLLPAAVVLSAAGVFLASSVSAASAEEATDQSVPREVIPASDFLNSTEAQAAWDEKIAVAVQRIQGEAEVPPQAPALLRTEFSEEKNEDGTLKPLVFEPSLVDSLVARYMHCSNLREIAGSTHKGLRLQSDLAEQSMEQLKAAEGIDGFFDTDEYAKVIDIGAKGEGVSSLEYELTYMCDVLTETGGE